MAAAAASHAASDRLSCTRSWPSAKRRQWTAPAQISTAQLTTTSRSRSCCSAAKGVAPCSAWALMATVTANAAVTAVGTPSARVWCRPAKRATRPLERAARARVKAKMPIAITGVRPTHWFIGVRPMKGVESPWTSMMRPTWTAPAARITSGPSAARRALTAAKPATTSAHAAIAVATTTWNWPDWKTTSSVGKMRSTTSATTGKTSAANAKIVAPNGRVNRFDSMRTRCLSADRMRT